MSAAQQQERTAKQAGLLGQIRVNAEFAGQDARDMVQRMFNRDLEQITEAQGWGLIRAIAPMLEAKREAIRAARAPLSGPHSHPCITCEMPVSCHRDDCREAAGEHHHCHQGFTVNEFNRTYKDSF
ncbi:MAG TPA: hypothetical protein VNI02_17480 [Blastocatellia bacterium]|jgi:hypothetical protein|nr:hypothetical protein [Blastocatellia bacterium]